MQDTILKNTNRKNLWQLLCLRLIAIVGQGLTILFVHYFLNIGLPLNAMFSLLLVQSFVNAISFYRYKSQKNISDKSLFFELLFDVSILTFQLYFSGGVSNPFISLFLLQVIIGAILLQRIYAWIISVITIFCYIFLSNSYRMLSTHHNHDLNHHGGRDLFDLHLHGMLISYVFATILLLIFITKIIKNLKDGQEKINLLQQKSLEKEQVVRMGLLATSAAHELGTPLSTISVILNDWQKINLPKDLIKDTKIIEDQLLRCKNILTEILSNSGKERFEHAKIAPIKKAFDDLIADWANLRKPQNLIYDFYSETSKEIIFDNVLKQAFFNIFDNALEASPSYIAIEVKLENEKILVIIEDRGKGFDKEIIQNIGKPNLSRKNSSGLGLFLTLNILDRVDGKLEIENIEDGARVKVMIPLQKL